jgi:hypothetical protein
MKILNNTNVNGQLTILTGSATTPSLSVATDTNTGIFFPTADTMAFTEGGVEAMRIDSSANIGIGTQTPSTKLEAVGTLSSSNLFTGRITSSSIGVSGNISASSVSSSTISVQAVQVTSSTIINSTGRVTPVRFVLPVGTDLWA